MNPLSAEDANWALHRLQKRVSFSGWFMAMVIGLWLWTIMIRLAL